MKIDNNVKSAIIQAMITKCGKIYFEKEEVFNMLNIGRSSFESLRTMGKAPKESRFPTASGTGKVLYHISDIAEFQLGGR